MKITPQVTLPYMKMSPKIIQDFEMTPQQNGRLSLTGNKRPAPQQKGDAKQGSILDYYN